MRTRAYRALVEHRNRANAITEGRIIGMYWLAEPGLIK